MVTIPNEYKTIKFESSGNQPWIVLDVSYDDPSRVVQGVYMRFYDNDQLVYNGYGEDTGTATGRKLRLTNDLVANMISSSNRVQITVKVDDEWTWEEIGEAKFTAVIDPLSFETQGFTSQNTWAQKSSFEVGETLRILISNGYDRQETLTIKHGSTVIETNTKPTYLFDYQVPAEWFSKAGVTSSTMNLTLTLADSAGRTASSKTITVKQTALDIKIVTGPASEEVDLLINAGENAYIRYHNRGSEGIKFRFEYGSYLLYEETADFKKYPGTDLNNGVYTIKTNEAWFANMGVTYDVSIQMKVVAIGLQSGREAHTFVTYKRNKISISISNSTIDVGSTQTVVVSKDGYGSKTFSITIEDVLGQKLKEFKKRSGEYCYFELKEDVFKTTHTTSNTLTIYVRAVDEYKQRQTSWYTLTRTALGMHLISYTTSDLKSYCETGSSFQIQFLGRFGRELDVWMTSSDGKPLYVAGNVYHMSIITDFATINCYAKWFDDANVTNSTSFNAIIYARDEYYRTATANIEIRAGADTYPDFTTTYIITQPSGFPSAIEAYYIQGYTKLGLSVNVTRKTNAAITRVYVRLYSDSACTKQVNQTELSLNEETGMYEGVTQNALAQSVYRRTYVTDQRRTVYRQGNAQISVIPYSAPRISNVHYHRCKSDGTADDGGEYLHLEVTYNFAPITVSGVSKNTKDANVHFDGYSSPPDVTKDPQSYSETITYLVGDANNRFSQEHVYDIVISATDLLNTTSRTYTLSTAGVIMDFLAGGKGIGLGKVAEHSKMVEVNPEWDFQAQKIKVYVNGQFRDLTAILEQLLGN